MEIPFTVEVQRSVCVYMCALGWGWRVAANNNNKNKNKHKTKQRASPPRKIIANILVCILACAFFFYTCPKKLSKYKF